MCYEMYIRASAVMERLPTVDMIQNERYTETLIQEIPHFGEHLLQRSLFYHADEFGSIDYFLLYLIVDESWKYLLAQNEKGLLLRDKTISVLRGTSDDNIYDDYILHMESYNVSCNEGIASVYVPSLNDYNPCLLYEVQSETYGSCTRKLVAFNKVRMCPYLEIPLEAYPFSVDKGNLAFLDDSENSEQVDAFELLQWEYMIKDDQLLICVSDMLRLLSFLPRPADSGAAPFLIREECFCFINICVTSTYLCSLLRFLRL